MRARAVSGLVSDLGDHSSASNNGTYQLHEIVRKLRHTVLLHIVTKHKFGLSGDIHIF